MGNGYLLSSPRRPCADSVRERPSALHPFPWGSRAPLRGAVAGQSANHPGSAWINMSMQGTESGATPRSPSGGSDDMQQADSSKRRSRILTIQRKRAGAHLLGPPAGRARRLRRLSADRQPCIPLTWVVCPVSAVVECRAVHLADGFRQATAASRQEASPLRTGRRAGEWRYCGGAMLCDSGEGARKCGIGNGVGRAGAGRLRSRWTLRNRRAAWRGERGTGGGCYSAQSSRCVRCCGCGPRAGGAGGLRRPRCRADSRSCLPQLGRPLRPREAHY